MQQTTEWTVTYSNEVGVKFQMESITVTNVVDLLEQINTTINKKSAAKNNGVVKVLLALDGYSIPFRVVQYHKTTKAILDSYDIKGFFEFDIYRIADSDNLDDATPIGKVRLYKND